MIPRALRAIVFVLLACCLAVGAKAQMIPMETIESIDVQVLNARTVAVGTISEITPPSKEDPEGRGYNPTEVTVAVQEALKGKRSDRVKVQIREPRALMEKWRSDSTRLLVFDPIRPEQSWQFRPIELDKEGLLVFSKDFKAIRNRDELLRYVRQLVRENPREQYVGTFVLPPPKTLEGESWRSLIGRPNIGGLRVPADKRLERIAHERLRSNSYEERSEALQALELFHNDRNVAVLKQLLKDPYFATNLPLESTWGVELRRYPIRQQAFDILNRWGIHPSEPTLTQEFSRIETVKSLESQEKITEDRLQTIRQAKSLTSLVITTYEPVPEGFLDTVAGASGLTHLQLPLMSIDDARLGKLAGLKHLRSLVLTRNPITDDGLKTLAEFKSLREVNLTETEVSDVGLAELRRARPDMVVKPDRAISAINLYIDRNDMVGVRRVLDRMPEVVGNDNGYTLGGLPLHEAAYQLRYEAVKLLLDRGASVQALNGYGHTALQSAMVYYRPDLRIIELLIAHGSDVNRVNKDGNPPLVVAAQMGNTQLVRLLLASGADPFAFTKERLGLASSVPEALDLLAKFTALKKNPIQLVKPSYARCDRTAYALPMPGGPLANWSTQPLGQITGVLQWGRTPSGREYLGPLGQQSATLKVTTLPEHRNVRVEIDLFVMGSWDGNGGLVYEPDIFDIAVPGVGTLLHSTFSNNGEDDAAGLPMQSFPDPYPFGFHPSFTGASEIRTLGVEQLWDGRVYRRDAVYKLVFTFAHTSRDLELLLSSLSATEGEGSLSESEHWGIGRLVVKTD